MTMKLEDVASLPIDRSPACAPGMIYFMPRGVRAFNLRTGEDASLQPSIVCSTADARSDTDIRRIAELDIWLEG